jgi:hypothetical protein
MANVLLLRFDEESALIRPTDELQNLDELVKSGASYPVIVDAATGLGRRFYSSNGDGLAAQDIDSGSTLTTRDASVQVILQWDIEATDDYGTPATIYARGLGTSAAEYLGAAIELRVVNAAIRIGELRWVWQDLSGATYYQIGGHFQVPADGFLMLTATRRWVSSTRVVLRYYLGDRLLAEVESSDGEIGGGTTGTTQIGTRYTGAAYDRFFDGIIDEIRVLDEELTAEEITATYRRITVDQPRGYQLVREVHDPGFPISQDPASRAQRETRLWGHALGFAAAQAENVRENILPDRAYGRVLTRWEAITKQAPRQGDDVETRRRRVVGRIRQRLGASIPGVGDALLELVDTDPANLEIVAFDQTIADDWDRLRWRYDPVASSTITKTGGVGGLWDAGAASTETFSGDCSVSVAGTNDATGRAFGLSTSDATASYDTIGHGLLYDGTDAYVIESGAFPANAPYADGDVLTVERVGSTVYYKIAGVTFYTSLVASTGDLVVDTSISTAAAEIVDLRAYDDGAPVSITWSGVTNVTIAASDGWGIASSALHIENASDLFLWSTWLTALASVGGDGRDAKSFAKFTPTALATQGEVGLVFVDRALGNAFLFGYRNDAGTRQLVTEAVLAGVPQGATVRATLGGLVPVWMCAEHDDDEETFSVKWSTTAADGPFTSVAAIAAGFSSFQWAGFYARTFSATTAAIDVAIDGSKIRAPYGDRPFRFYVVRDPDDPGSPDYLGANAVIRGLKQAHTDAHVVRTLIALCDDDETTCDDCPMGGI